MPTRAFRYCEPATSASGYGYYIFPPISFSLQWDGRDVMWTWEGAGTWLPLKAAQFPISAPVRPDRARGDPRIFPAVPGRPAGTGSGPVLDRIVARTAPGWSLMVRAPANIPRSGGYELFEGIIETDRWFGPLITNMRLAKTDVPIDFRADFPLLQVQPIPRHAYDDATLNNYELVPELKQLTPEDWDDYYDTVVRPHVQEVRPRGQYAAAARKRRAAEEDGNPRADKLMVWTSLFAYS